jgi:hypothetical protein
VAGAPKRKRGHSRKQKEEYVEQIKKEYTDRLAKAVVEELGADNEVGEVTEKHLRIVMSFLLGSLYCESRESFQEALLSEPRILEEAWDALQSVVEDTRDTMHPVQCSGLLAGVCTFYGDKSC